MLSNIAVDAGFSSKATSSVTAGEVFAVFLAEIPKMDTYEFQLHIQVASNGVA